MSKRILLHTNSKSSKGDKLLEQHIVFGYDKETRQWVTTQGPFADKDHYNMSMRNIDKCFAVTEKWTKHLENEYYQLDENGNSLAAAKAWNDIRARSLQWNVKLDELDPEKQFNRVPVPPAVPPLEEVLEILAAHLSGTPYTAKVIVQDPSRDIRDAEDEADEVDEAEVTAE